MKTSHIEILAPAGSFETLNTALNAGCDSVYFGIAEFNMRASAAINFVVEDLPEIVKLCKAKNVKSYVTINTVLYNEELDKMRNIVDAVKEAGADAIIASDMATILYARSQGVNVHISTQLSISNTESVKYYSQFTDRIVLARELNLEQIKKISDDIKNQKIKGPKGKLVELEAFAHGALCAAVSGRCSMSLYCYNRSANRGKCLNVCRRKYKVIDLETKKELIIDNNYVMSAADLSTIGMLPELIDAGITTLKIEGRGRAAEYVDTVIRTYKEALNSIEDGTYTHKKIKEWNKRLGTVYNRGNYQGFYMGKGFHEWAGTDGSKATEEKFQAGIVEHYFTKKQVAQIKITDQVEFSAGEKYYITGQTTGLIKGLVKDMMVNDKKSDTAKQGDIITLQVKDRVRQNDRFFIVRKKNNKW